LFDWLQNGEVEFSTAGAGRTVHLTAQSAKHWRAWVSSIGALICGRTPFDVADGWNGQHDFDAPVVVVTFSYRRIGSTHTRPHRSRS
jgi:hypothetical protein